ncbi:HYR domain-containing protein [Algoriphagus marinus]|uniref:HYR domain-containing protein n=1 Tax=Algoriphagus marinus TaxID=1925762 RepID=UPI001C377CE7|nr:HYR domain-containing protein [Algoriphagus marinus]
MVLQYLTGAAITDNDVILLGSSSSSSDGFFIDEVEGAFRFTGNRIEGANQYGLYMTSCTATAGSPALIANNQIHSKAGSYSVYFVSNQYQGFYHNNINTTGGAQGIYYFGSGGAGNKIKNNIFKSNTGYAVNVANSTGLDEMDYNDFFTSGVYLGRWGTSNATDLNSWKSLSGKDANSLNVDPQFISNTDLLAQSPSLTEAGVDLTSFVSTDIDGNPRTAPVSIGANEFAIVGAPLIGDYTLDPAGSGDRNFTTFAAASEALTLNGISGAVRFLIADGTYTGQVNLGSVSGTTETSTITFESANENPDLVVISHIVDYTLKLDNAEHYIFKNLTFETTGTAQVIQVRNRATDLLFEGLKIQSPIATGTSALKKAIDIAPSFGQNTRVLNNTVTGGVYGIYISSNGSNNRMSGTLVSGNTLNEIGFRGIYLNNQLAPEIIGNTLNTSSTEDQISIYAENVSEGLLVKNNRVVSGKGNALRLVNIAGSASISNLVYNNFFYSEGPNRAVYLSNTDYLQFYHNSIWNQSAGAALEYASSGGSNKFVNNIFQSGTGYALKILATSAIAESNYNNLFTTGSNLGLWGASTNSNLAAWRSSSSQDLNSVTVNSDFFSSSNLVPQNEALASNGFDLTAIVSTDIEDNPRTLPVSLGAVEFTAVNGLDISANAIIDPSSDCSLTTEEAVSLRIENVGSTFAENLILAYSVNGTEIIQETLPIGLVLSPGEVYTYTFTQKADLSSKGDYLIAGYLVGIDENSINDRAEKNITHYPDIVATISPDQTICKNTFASLTATGGTSYLWSNGSVLPSISVNPSESTTYSVIVTNGNGCSVELFTTVQVAEIPTLRFVGDEGYESDLVSPTVGTNETDFVFRVKYSEVNGSLPDSGYPKVVMTSDLETLEFSMVEEDPADSDVTNGKIYTVTVSGLTNDVNWNTRIQASNEGGCLAIPLLSDRPLVTTDFLDIAIFADDILFSNDEPAIGENFTITAKITNTSDYLAENFDIFIFDDQTLIKTDQITSVDPQSFTDYSFDYAFTNSGFHEIKVVLDSAQNLLEKNELNNFAIRFYALPEGISVSANTNKTTYYVGENVTISGLASFTGLDPAVTPKVKNATVRWVVSDGRVRSTFTSSQGTFGTTFSGFPVTGNYTVSGEVDDGRFVESFGPLTISVVEDPNVTLKPDLVSDISINFGTKNYFLAGETVTGTAKVTNTGDAIAENFVVRYSSCEGVLAEFVVESLNPGEFIEYPFTTIPSIINNCSDPACFVEMIVDPFNQVSEKVEYNNSDRQNFKNYSSTPELRPLIIGGETFNLEDPYVFNVRAYNDGGIATASSVNVNVYLDGVLFDSRTVPVINRCGAATFSLSNLFTTTSDHVIEVKVDEPIGSGEISEGNENNNTITKIIKYLPKKPDLSTSKYLLSVIPKLPIPGESFTIQAKFSNSGYSDLVASFENKFTIREDGIDRTETSVYSDGLLKNEIDSIQLVTQIASYGNHSVSFVTDNLGEIEEVSESNNSASMPLCVDLKPSIRFLSGVWKGEFQVYTVQNLYAYIQNTGLFIPSNVNVRFYLDDVLIEETSIDEIPTTYSGLGNFVSVPHIFTEAGTFTLKVVVDETDDFTECNESDNSYSRQITINTPGPDLRVLPPYISPTKINPDLDEQINVFVSFDNIGVVPAGPFKVRLNVDGVQLGDDVLVSGVAAGEDGTVAITQPYSSAVGGLKNLEAIIDVEEVLDDANRNNNSAIRSIFVGDAPNLYFEDLGLSVDCPENGELITVDITVGNEGDVGTEGTLILYHKIGDELQEIARRQVNVGPKTNELAAFEFTVLSNTFELYAEIVDAYPYEYNLDDNSITKGYCENLQFVLSSSVVGSGVITRSPNENNFDPDSEVVLTAIPAVGWRFNQWLGDATGASDEFILTMDSDKDVIAEFEEIFRIDINITNESCVDAGNGKLEVITFAGTGPFTLELFKEGNLIATNSSSNLFDNLSKGSYEVRVTDSNSTVVSEFAEIVVSDLEAPNINVKQNITVYLNDLGIGTLTIGMVENGSVDNCGIAEYYFETGLEAIDFDCSNIGIENTVNYKVVDTNGNVATEVVLITVVEEIKPVITNVPANINIDNDANTCGAVVTWTEPDAADNCGIATFTSNRQSGETFPEGETIVTYTATDIHGNVETASFTVTVIDSQLPVITTNGDQNLDAEAGLCEASFTATASATDNCAVGEPTGVRSDGLDLTAPYPVGQTTIIWNVSDVNGNAGEEVLQTITVTDNQLPVISTNGNQNLDAETGLCEASFAATASATDNCAVGEPIGVRSDGLDLTAPYPVGETIITWNVLDVNGNAAEEVVQTITVRDNQLPVITTNGDQNLDAEAGLCEASFAATASATDNCSVGDPIGVRSDGLDLTAPYPVGETTITWNVSDVNGKAAETVIQTITVTDNQLPVITTNGDQNLNATAGLCEASFTATASANDNCSVGEPTGVRSDGLDLTAPYPVGETTITWNVSDINTNAAEEVVQTITVRDNQLPVITTNGDQNLDAEAVLCEASFAATASATDNCAVGDPTGVRSDGLDLTAPYPVGQTTIIWNVSDVNGNAGEEVLQTITVTDNQLPVITTNGDQNLEAEAGLCEASFTATASATDNCAVGDPTGVRSDGLELTAPYQVGETTIAWNVSDVNGKAAEVVVQTITVIDNQLPVITCPSDISTTVAFGETGKVVTYDLPIATDNCGIASLELISGLASGEFFPLGSTTILYQATDFAGNTMECSFTVDVSESEDNEDPIINDCPVGITVETDPENCGALVNWIEPTATDNSGSVILNSNFEPGTLFQVGITTVIYTATDGAGNQSTCSFTVTVIDSQPPVITTNGDQNLDAEAGLCEASFTATASATDNCSVGEPTGVRSDGLDLTAPYPVGETTITWNVSDVNGKAAEAVTQTITVTDNQLPVITTNGDQNLDAEAGLCEASFTATASATDNCSVGEPTGVRSDGLDLTAPYPVGETIITWNVLDVNGNAAEEVVQTITVRDNQLPVITANGDQNLDAEAGLCEASFAATASATDNCAVGDPTGVRSDGLELTAPYPVGETTITWNVSDVNGKAAEAVVQTITVIDNQLPVITCPSDISTTVAFGETGKVINYDLPIATDNCGIASLELISGLASGEFFPLGSTPVIYQATDFAGNTKECSFKIDITESGDNEDPIISDCPVGITVETDADNCGALVDWIEPTATDNSGSVILNSNFEPGTLFPVGITTVIYTATDGAGNQSTCSFNVTVTDTQLPVITTNGDQNLDTEAGLCEASFTATASATDNCAVGDPTGVRSDGLELTAPYPVGETTITWNVSDVNGNAAEEVIQTITVNDIEKPLITNVPGNIIVNNDEGVCGAIVSWIEPEAIDNCGIDTFNSNYQSGTIFPVGETIVTYTAKDIHGNGETASFMVTVVDSELPTVITRNRTFNIDEGETLTITPQDVNDGTFDNCGILSLVLDNYTFSSVDVGDNMVILTARDVNGNENDETAIVTIILNENDSDGDGFKPSEGDCDDFNNTVYPGAPEICDGIDNDCDGLVDDADPDAVGLTTYYLDQDGDGFGDPNNSIESCNMPLGYVANPDDCDDSDEFKNPGIAGSCSDEPCLSDLEIISISGPLDPKPVYSKIKVSAMVLGSIVEAYWDWDDGTTTSVINYDSDDKPRHDKSDYNSRYISSLIMPNKTFNGFNTKHKHSEHKEDSDCDDDDDDDESDDFGFDAQHVYSKAGVYQIKLVVIDECGNKVERLTDLAVIYDPDGGFVTGGGTIWSPKGAYLQDMNAEGRANFGFVAKYKKGSNRVDGNTEFQFKNGGLNFNSSSYDDMSLVIAGYKAIYKGKGTINGNSGYSFMVSAVDGDKKDDKKKYGKKEIDKFRIKIWNSSTSEIIYDNEKGASDYKEASTKITGGSITVHSPEKRKNKSYRELELMVVDWNTSKERIHEDLTGIENSLSEKPILWNMDQYDPILEGVQFVEGVLKDSELGVLSENVQVSVLVLDKPSPTDILLSNVIIPIDVKEGDIIAVLKTVDTADDFHSYELLPNSNFKIEENRLIWKGNEMGTDILPINISSSDIVGNVLTKEFELFREMQENSVLVYPNPAVSETNVKIDISQPSIIQLKVFDATGRLVFEESGDYEKGFIRNIDLRALSNGLYQIQVQINNQTITRRLIKNN